MSKIGECIAWFQYMTEKNTIIDILIALAIIIVFTMMSGIIAKLGVKCIQFKEKCKKGEIKESPFYKPIKWMVISSGLYVAMLVVNPTEKIQAVGTMVFRIVLIWLIANAVTNLFDPKTKVFQLLKKQDRFQGNDTLAKFAGKVIRAVIYMVAAFLTISELGYDITGIIAGLGFGGVVIALAAQDLAKSLFGGFIILIDKPFIVGEWIKAGEYEGTVEDITFRSTRIRTLDNMEAVIQNSTIAEASIINYSRMSKRRYALQFLLPLHTPSSTIQQVMKRIRLVLQTNPNLLQKEIEVHNTKIGAEGIQIEVSVYTTVVSMYPYFGVRDEVNQMVLNILESENLSMAYAGQDVYVKQ